MTFDDIIKQSIDILRQRRRVSRRTLKLQFSLDDEHLEALVSELVSVLRVATEESGMVLTWAGPDVAAARADASADAPAARDAEPLDDAERRQLTVLFCDLVSSTELSGQLDPEDLREVVRMYQDVCGAVIARAEGRVAQYLGDGLLVYFGFPSAHEDDAYRAVRAGLGVIEAIDRINPKLEREKHVRLALRVGIHTGLVVVGEVGSGTTKEQLALGDTPNIAARLQALAEPGRVLVSAATYRLVAGLFECRELGLQTLKGVAQPMAVYEVLNQSMARSRLDVAAATGLTPLVGREREMERLLACWQRARAGRGQLVVLTGEPGIGKSRLVHTVEQHVAQDPDATITACICSAYYQHTAFHPVVDLLERVVLRFERDESPGAKHEKLEAWLRRAGLALGEAVPLFAQLLSIPLGTGYAPLSGPPDRVRHRTLETLVQLLLPPTTASPVLFVVEDVHWADASSREVLDRLVREVGHSRMLAVFTYRPDFTPPAEWAERAELTPLALERLPQASAREIVRFVSAGKAIPDVVLDQVIARTEGVPLFIEELMKMVLESGLLRDAGDAYELSGPLPPLAIPTTLRDSLMARLDRLTSVKSVAQLGATIGREFNYDLLRAVTPMSEATLRLALQELVDAELLYQRGALPDATFIFKHALIQEIAYQSLLRSSRHRYHQRIAETLEARFARVVETQPEVLGRHYAEAGMVAQAIGYWQRAGERALSRSAHVEAASHLRQGLELCRSLPDIPQRARQELTLLMALGSAIIMGSGYTAPAVEETYARARALYPQVQDDPVFSRVPFAGMYVYYHGRGAFPTAIDLAEQLLVLGTRQGDAMLMLDAHSALGLTRFTVGEFEQARRHVDQDLAAYPIRPDAPAAYTIGVEPGVSCLSFGGPIRWMLGYPDQARRSIAAALERSAALGHPFSRALALSWAAVLYQLRRDVPGVRQAAEEAAVLSGEQGFVYWEALSSCWLGWALAQQGEVEAGIARLRKGMDFLWAIGIRQCRSWCLALLAECERLRGAPAAALELVNEGLSISAEIGEHFYEAELHRLRGVLLLDLAPDSPQEAERFFRAALELSRRQQTRSWALRAATSLAHLSRDSRIAPDAPALLAEIHGWFTEGFDTPDIRDARSALAI